MGTFFAVVGVVALVVVVVLFLGLVVLANKMSG